MLWFLKKTSVETTVTDTSKLPEVIGDVIHMTPLMVQHLIEQNANHVASQRASNSMVQ